MTGLSAFVYMPFYVFLVWSLLTGRNWIQLPSVIYATMISTIRLLFSSMTPRMTW